MPKKIDICSLYDFEIEELISKFGEPKYRAKQVIKWLRNGVDGFEDMKNIPILLRQKLEEECFIANVKIAKKLVSKIDGTVKYLYELYDGEYIESVLMKYEHGYTVCVSTQVGCRMGCKFCASGLFGLTRNLSASEILAQITTAAKDNNIRVSNVVMMGMGEPLDNFENTERFLKLVTHEDGLGIGLRHISLSTSGLVSGIKKLSELNLPITLSVSLHAPSDEIRNKTMPINKKWNIEKLLDACREYQKITTRRISFEYALIEGINDSKECADLLAKRLEGIMCHVNLIPANPVKENTFKKPNIDAIRKFAKYLEAKGVNATIRRTLGADINASCGQLRKKEGHL
ncbi:MAG: 23S rRNA (adenine(2503)-C(2))-methyltransferase RlmN [Clostridia bacterium]|nr:23S rRNA (adenine(2503)-C(2))-methyltransferase RlmN [Clostridia bacterium]